MRDILIRPVILFLIVVAVGTAGYVLLEHWSVLDAIYMVAITLSTVGFREVRDISPAGRIFTIFLILFGISTGAYLITRIGELFIQGQVLGYARRRRMNQRIGNLKNHYIVCGFGRVGRQVCEEFRRDGIEFVVIDQNEKLEHELAERGYLYLIGDAAEEEILAEAGIRTATGVAVAVDSDADSVFVTLTARSLNASARIVAVSREQETEHKLRRAGATRVVSPFLIAGRRLASMAARPAIVDFLDTVTQRTGDELRLEEIRIPDSSDLVGKTLGEADLRRRAGVMVLGIIEQSGSYHMNPAADVGLATGQTLIALGTSKQLDRLKGVV